MSAITRESGVSGKRTLEVKVKFKPGSPKRGVPPSVSVRPLTLTNNVSKVVWSCTNRPENTRLQILFRGDPRGPFYVLEETSTGEVRGHGNRGPDETDEQYTYTVKIIEASPEPVAMAASFGDSMGDETDSETEGTGELNNEATDPVCPDPPIEIPPP